MTAPYVARGALRRRRNPMLIVTHAVVILITLTWFVPILGFFISSLRTPADQAESGWWGIFQRPVFTLFNYQQAFGVLDIGASMATSLAIAVPVTVLTTLISTIGAYALTRMRFVGRTVLSTILVAMLVVPPQVILVPLIVLFSSIGLMGTVPAVWIFQVGFTVPYGIFLIRGFIAAMPQDLFEAAALDGAGTLRTFRSVVVPLALPVMASLAILQFLWSWNDLLIPLLFMGGSDLAQPITVQVVGLVQQTGQGESMLVAATFVSILIPLAILIGMQRLFVRGILGGAVKG